MQSRTMSHVTATRDCARVVPQALPSSFRHVSHGVYRAMHPLHAMSRHCAPMFNFPRLNTQHWRRSNHDINHNTISTRRKKTR